MSRKDDITGKKAMSGNNRSKALNSTKRTFRLNLQSVTVLENGEKKKLKVTAKTARTLKKQGKLA
ncbi:MAG: 50S ribosomal protein L28 [Mycoplasmataceae bacterium]|nr:50S ribosomal protein L28 [Mycoplasmataceae bacterium]